MKHTPGPWTTEIMGALFRRDGVLMLEIRGRETTYAEKEANARLIAAAPELLAACKMLLELAENHPEWKARHGKEVLTARAAIAKAEAE